MRALRHDPQDVNPLTIIDNIDQALARAEAIAMMACALSDETQKQVFATVGFDIVDSFNSLRTDVSRLTGVEVL